MLGIFRECYGKMWLVLYCTSAIALTLYVELITVTVVEKHAWEIALALLKDMIGMVGWMGSGTLCCINCNVKNCISQSINFHKACTVSGVIVEKHAWDIALVLWKDMVGMVVTWVQLKFMVCTAHRPQY